MAKKTIIKFGDIEIQKPKFHQHKAPISIKNLHIDKMIVPNKFRLVKKDLNILLFTKKILNLYVSFSQKDCN